MAPSCISRASRKLALYGPDATQQEMKRQGEKDIACGVSRETRKRCKRLQVPRHKCSAWSKLKHRATDVYGGCRTERQHHAGVARGAGQGQKVADLKRVGLNIRNEGCQWRRL